MTSFPPVPYHLIDRPAFTIAGKQTFITGPDNTQFGRFWDECRAAGLLETLAAMRGRQAAPQTNAAVLGVSRVEQDPANRAFFYMIAVEVDDANNSALQPEDAALETYSVPAGRWAVFECHGTPPDLIVAAEMFAFGQWLPNSQYRHALAPEMEVYPTNGGETYCEFWLPVEAVE